MKQGSRVHIAAMDELLARQQEQLRSACRTLQEIMPEFFFRSLQNELSSFLPMVCSLTPSSGIRRVDAHGESFLIYLKSSENNPLDNSRHMTDRRLAAATVHQSEKPLMIDGVPYTLVVEQFRWAPSEQLPITVSLADLQQAYSNQFGPGSEAAVAEIYPRLNGSAVADLDAERLAQRLRAALAAQADDLIHAETEPWDADSIRLTVSRSFPVSQPQFFRQLLEVADISGFEPLRAYFRELSFSAAPTDFEHMPVMVVTLYLKKRADAGSDAECLDKLLRSVRLVSWVEMDDMLHQELVLRHHFPLAETDLLRAAGEFVHSQLAYVDHHAFPCKDVFRLIALYPDLARRLLEAFHRHFDPECPEAQSQEIEFSELSEAIHQVNSGDPERDDQVKIIFSAIQDFFAHILKCNFFVRDKSALAFRLAPGFMEFYRGLNGGYAAAFPADRPWGVFFFHRRKAIGYHVRFAEIARGGWRSVIPRRGAHRLVALDNYDSAKDTVFQEVFVLAHTQHLKNKDIFEGGAKMITLLEPVEEPDAVKPLLWQSQRSIADALLSLIIGGRDGRLSTPGIVDHLGKRELIELGPDENMSDAMIRWIGRHAVRNHYALGAGIISGKPDTGINHKAYGVTSFGVYQYVLKTLAELGIAPERDAFSVEISGGPAGDVAGNLLKLLLAEDADGHPVHPGLKIIAVSDGPAAAYDPDGLDREELRRLLFRSNLDGFRPERLHGEGAYLVFAAPELSADDVERHRLVRRTGGTLEETRIGRDSFVRMVQHNLVHRADLFIPAGGRPSTIHEGNCGDFLDSDGPVFRAIVEGANSYLTPGAREYLEQKGVLIVKDASANKCGVITSSYEILAGLMLTEQEFKCGKEELVREVMNILRERATQEANWLYSHMHRERICLTRLTERLSREINARNVEITEFLGTHPEFITDSLVRAHLPELFSREYAERTRRLPAEYRLAVVAVELARRMVYADGDAGLGSRLLALMSPEEQNVVKKTTKAEA